MDTMQLGIAPYFENECRCQAYTKAMTGNYNLKAASNLCYRIGKVDGARVELGSCNPYSEGYRPSIALNSKNSIVEVHESNDLSTHSLHYKVGEVKESSIDWGFDVNYGNGLQPKISINDLGDVVEVHKSIEDDDLYCVVGKIDLLRKIILWGTPKKYGIGVTPTISTNDNGLVVEAHKSSFSSQLNYHVGQILDQEIVWGPIHKYLDGFKPDICITNDRKVVEMHESEGVTGIWRITGYVNKKNVILRCSTIFDSESNLRMEMSSNKKVAVYVHEGHVHKLKKTGKCIFRNFFELLY